MILRFNIDDIINNPYTVKSGNFEYTFDGFVRNGKMVIFVKILEDPENNCGRETLEKIRKAMSLANTYYDNNTFNVGRRRMD